MEQIEERRCGRDRVAHLREGEGGNDGYVCALRLSLKAIKIGAIEPEQRAVVEPSERIAGRRRRLG